MNDSLDRFVAKRPINQLIKALHANPKSTGVEQALQTPGLRSLAV